MNKETKEKRKQYLKDIKTHRKNLVAIAKDAGPWDYGWSIEFFIEHLRMMKDYYTVGYNVHALEADGSENDRLFIVNKLLSEYEASNELPISEKQAIADDMGVDVQKMEDNLVFTHTTREDGCRITTVTDKYYDHYTYIEYVHAVHDAEDAHRKAFFEFLLKKYEYLYD